MVLITALALTALVLITALALTALALIIAALAITALTTITRASTFFAHARAMAFGFGTSLEFLIIADDVDTFSFVGALLVFQSRT